MNPRLAAARALASVLSGKASLGSSLPPLLDKVDARDRGLAQDLARLLGGYAGRMQALDRGDAVTLHGQHGIDEQAVAARGRNAAGRGVGTRDQPEVLEIAHHVAYGRR